jgi:hypothetical protein
VTIFHCPGCHTTKFVPGQFAPGEEPHCKECMAKLQPVSPRVRKELTMSETATKTEAPAGNGDLATAQGGMIPAPAAPPAPGKDLSLLMSPQRIRSFTNLDVKSDEGLALLTRCEAQSGKKFEECINLKINLVAVYIKTWWKIEVSEEGEETQTEQARIVLIDDQNETYGCSSVGVRDSLREIVAAKGIGPWRPGLPVRLVQVAFTRKKTGGGAGEPGRIFKLLYEPEPKPAAAAKAKARC